MLAERVLFTVIISISGIIIIRAKNLVYPCTTPDNDDAYCVSLFECPGLMTSLSSLAPSAIEFVRKSICLGCNAGDFMVCCGSKNSATPKEKMRAPSTDLEPPLPLPLLTTTAVPVNESKRSTVLRTLLPDLRYCGFQHTDDRYYNGTVTALDEFPWLVHVKFTDIYSEYKLGDRCTGVLISNKYILTDTICAKTALKVRLGQYGVSHKVTCIENPQAHECNEGTIEVRVDKKIVLLPDALETYSLSLIRLEKGVEYSDFVRPICLPLKEARRPAPEVPLTFSGWGAIPTSITVEDAIKKRLVYDSAEMSNCTEVRESLGNYLHNSSTPLRCFTPKATNKDIACDRDHGGPLMHSDSRHQWYVENVVVEVLDRGNGRCSKGNAVLAVKITPELIDAILTNMDP